MLSTGKKLQLYKASALGISNPPNVDAVAPLREPMQKHTTIALQTDSHQSLSTLYKDALGQEELKIPPEEIN